MTDPTPCDAAIFYHPDGYVTSRGKLMGRHAAGEGFLLAFARHARQSTLYAYCETREHYDTFCGQVQSAANGKKLEWLPAARPEGLAAPGTLYLPGPDVSTHAWVRRARDSTAYSLAGITHTICTHRVMDSVGEMLTGPVEPWDALMCTSDAVRRGVDAMLSAYGEYLRERLGAGAATPELQLPVIPLGVDCDRLAAGADADAVRNRLRHRHGIGADDICVLFVGRLSFHAKAHPMPMYQALEAAAQKTGRRLHLVQAGWFATDGIKRAFIQGARALCPSVRVTYVDGRKQEIRNNIWRAADIFCSLSDNVQETFGLTPVEAMSAGLPVVASDWDGYRGTVEQGVTGFLVPTTIPAPGSGEELAYRHLTGLDNYDQYLGNSCQAVAVDAAEVARAFVELIDNPELRRRMGEAGAARARSLFDWPVVIAAYQSLWEELGARRRRARESGAGGPKPVPLRADPYTLFGHYATRVMNDDCLVESAAADPGRAFRRLSGLQFNGMGRELFLEDEAVDSLLGKLRTAAPARVGDLLRESPEGRRPALARTLVWLAKMGIVKIAG